MATSQREVLLSQPRSESSSAISDVTSPVKLVGKARAIALGSKSPLINPGPSLARWPELRPSLARVWEKLVTRPRQLGC